MARLDQLVSLAIEIVTTQSKAMDCTKERVTVARSFGGGYSLKDWASDVLRLLPDDRVKAMEILKHHAPGDATAPEDRRRVGQYVGQYYRQLKRRQDLIHAGERFWRLIG